MLAFAPAISAAYQAESRQILIAGEEEHEIQLEAPAQVTALALTENMLVVAGGTDRADVMSGGFLRIIDINTGEAVAEERLPAEAVFDGIAVSRDRVLVTTQDGSLHVFTTQLP